MTARRSRQAPPGRRSREQDRQRQIAELHNRVDVQLRSLVTGEDWAAWLRLAARLPGLGFTNVLLVAAQRPGATFVAGYQAWQAQGRHVRNGEPGIQVFAEPRAPSGRPRSSRAAGTGTSRRRREPRAEKNASRTYGTSLRPKAIPALIPLPYLLQEERHLDSGTPLHGWPGARDSLSNAGSATMRPGLTDWSTRRIRIRPGLDPSGSGPSADSRTLPRPGARAPSASAGGQHRRVPRYPEDRG